MKGLKMSAPHPPSLLPSIVWQIYVDANTRKSTLKDNQPMSLNSTKIMMIKINKLNWKSKHSTFTWWQQSTLYLHVSRLICCQSWAEKCTRDCAFSSERRTVYLPVSFGFNCTLAVLSEGSKFFDLLRIFLGLTSGLRKK